MFVNEYALKKGSWQAFERTVARLLLYEGFEGIRLVGQSGDRGGDLIAHKYDKRWLFQVKHWRRKVGVSVLDETVAAARTYKAQIPVVVSLNGFDSGALEHQERLQSHRIPIQLWDCNTLHSHASRLPEKYSVHPPRDYQEDAITPLVREYFEGYSRRALIVMATGLGKTFVACEAIRRMAAIENQPLKVLVLAHTNELVYQFERAVWPFLTTLQETVVWNGYEQPSGEDLRRASVILACINSVADNSEKLDELSLDLIVVDECHHVGGGMYQHLLSETRAGFENGPFLIGLTATPWRGDETDLREYFGNPLVSIDMVTGLKKGFLSNVDYRMHTDNINWQALGTLSGHALSPRQINRTLFINQWDDAVVYELQKVWSEQDNPKCIVFCGTIDHALTMRDKINALGFCNAAALYSQAPTLGMMTSYERNRVLCDFHDGTIQVVCAVDIFNEGVDVPDVNIIVFQRVTHSRRIFVQQLGRGLRIAPGKEKVIVLDFVSDIRRFAAGLQLKQQLANSGRYAGPVRIDLPHKVAFRKVGGEDPATESFLRQWLDDVAAIEMAGEDASILRFPPDILGGTL